MQDRTRHRPVLLRETISEMQLAPGQVIVDGTVGAAGHSRKILEKIQPGGKLLGLDRDRQMLVRAAKTLSGESHEPAERIEVASDAILIHSSYAELEDALKAEGIEKVDAILVDLGLSSDQLESAERGFGFKTKGDLDMRFDESQGKPISEWLHQATIAEITMTLTEFGEEPLAQKLAEKIAFVRKSTLIQSAPQLGELVEEVYRENGRKVGSSHPATRTFQALRIQANAELEHLQRFLTTVAPACLKPGGRLAVISFHSLEDRMVKNALLDREIWQESSRKPTAASPLECKMNPRARSAKLRIGIRAE
ncbi:16S rRNA (cytosine(1402)-N(4))-methyltransferase RsmH [Rubinisphaera italica]|nr:16S rRNA (cytosine(1402)-N(4))-methyltransferase RsmH [Rubinisphaera italica]